MPTFTPQALDAHSRKLIEHTNALTAAVPADQLSIGKRRALMREANALLMPPEGPDRKSTRLNSSHPRLSRMPSSA